MRYKHKTEEELEKDNVFAPLPAGAYWATVFHAEDQVSKKGNEMIMVKLDINGRHVYDYLSGSFMEFKLRHFCKSAGKLDLYEKDALSAEDVLRWRVIAYLEIESKEGFADKNRVVDYFLESECSEPIGGDGSSPTPVVVVESASDLPF